MTIRFALLALACGTLTACTPSDGSGLIANSTTPTAVTSTGRTTGNRIGGYTTVWFERESRGR